MKIKLLPGLFTALALVFFMNSCSKNDDDGGQMPDGGDEPLPNIVELAESVNVLSTFVDALDIADDDLSEALTGEGSFTVFAPTNDAFNALIAELEGFDGLDDFDEDDERALLTEILRYHVVEGVAAFSDMLSDGRVLTTLQSEDLTVVVDSSVFLDDATDTNAEVVSADNEALNGVVHVIDKVLLPEAVLEQLFPQSPVGTLVSEIENLSLLNEALTRTNLVDDLNAEGPFTLFAPSNEAIEGLFEQLGQDFASFDDFSNPVELQVLRSLLLYHVVPDELASTDLQAGPLVTLLEGESIEIVASGDSFEISDATDENAGFDNADNEASNGVVHIIDKVLIPQFILDFLGDDDNPPNAEEFTIAELVQSSDDFSLLADALELTGLLETLDGEGPFTVFAPDNDALQSLFPLLGTDYNGLEDFDTTFEIGLLRTVLAYHVVPELALASADFSERELSTLAGDDTLELIVRGNTFALVDAVRIPVDFILTDITAENGVVHAVERILLPASVIDLVANETMRALMEFFERYEVEIDNSLTLLRMLSSGLDEIIEGGEFTLFLPTNQAFLDLFDSLDGIDSLADFDTEAELRLLITILEYHCVESIALETATLGSGSTVTTVQGESLEVVRTDNSIQVLDQSGEVTNVTSADNELLGGVVHFIDRVLLPNEVLNAL